MAAALAGNAPTGPRTVRGADESVYERVLDAAAG
jgi:hypothetical protein